MGTLARPKETPFYLVGFSFGICITINSQRSLFTSERDSRDVALNGRETRVGGGGDVGLVSYSVRSSPSASFKGHPFCL